MFGTRNSVVAVVAPFAVLLAAACAPSDDTAQDVLESFELTDLAFTVDRLGGIEVQLADARAEDPAGNWAVRLDTTYEAIGDFDDDGIDETATLMEVESLDTGQDRVIAFFQAVPGGDVVLEGQVRMIPGSTIERFEARGDTVIVTMTRPGPRGIVQRVQRHFRAINGEFLMVLEATAPTPSEG